MAAKIIYRFAIIGCGAIAKRHAEQINHFGKLIAVCDIVKEKADEFANLYSANPYYNIDVLLNSEQGNIDVAVICTPNGLHAEQTIQSLQNGCHVLVEKPMAIKAADCIIMIRESEQAGKHLFVVKQNRYNPPVAAVKKVLEQGLLGEIFSVQLNCFWNRDREYFKSPWKGTLELDGGTLFTQFSHFIDLLYWFFGDVKEVKAIRKNFDHADSIEFEDSGVVTFEFVHGMIGTMHYSINSFQKNMEGSLTILAENGSVKIGGQYLNELEYAQIRNFDFDKLPISNGPNQYENYTGSMSNHDKVYENLLAALSGEDSFITSPIDGLKTVEIIEKIYHYPLSTNIS